MSYPLELGEYPEAELIKELETRRAARAKGQCDYCFGRMNSNLCAFPDRHRASLGLTGQTVKSNDLQVAGSNPVRGDTSDPKTCWICNYWGKRMCGWHGGP